MTTTTTTAMTLPPCAYCNGYHSGTCPRIEAIEYHPNGTVKRIEFKDPYMPAQSRCPARGRPCFCTGACMGRAALGGGNYQRHDIDFTQYR
jgi:hypothetical protein